VAAAASGNGGSAGNLSSSEGTNAIHVLLRVCGSQNPSALTADRIKLGGKIGVRGWRQPTSIHCLFECVRSWWKTVIGSSAIEFVALGFRKSHELETFMAI